MSAPVDVTTPRPAAAPGEAIAARRAALWAMLAAKTLGMWGVQWDIRWHVLIGRDTFWIAPHLMTYAGVVSVALLSFSILASETLRVRRGDVLTGTVRVLGLTGTRGFHIVWWGIALTVLAAPIDDLWHRLFGLDVTLWSPPHLLGVLGAQVNTIGCLVIARELWPERRRARTVAMAWSGTLLLAMFAVVLDEAFQVAFRRGGALFFLWAILAGLTFTFALALTAALAGTRSAPLVIAAGLAGLHLVGLVISDAGFAWLEPTPAIEEAIASDPDSPIAIAHEMARRSGSEPGRVRTVRMFPLLPAALMALADPRRRWRTASLAFGAALLVVSTVMLWRSPALNHALPAPGAALVGAVLALGAALAGGAAALGLARRLPR